MLRQSNYNDTPITDDDKAQYSKTDLTNTDATYTVEYKEKGTLKYIFTFTIYIFTFSQILYYIKIYFI